MFTPTAGMDTYKLQANYDFSNIGISGLNSSFIYVISKHSAPDEIAGMNPAGVKKEYEGYSFILNYKTPWLKGLNASLTYTMLDQEITPKGGNTAKTDIDELWVKLSYKF